MATFPSYPFLMRDGFGIRRMSAAQRTEMEDGFVKQRRRWSRVLVERPVIYGMRSKSDYLNFITWFNTSIDRGSAWFDWTDPVDSVVKQARIKGGLLEEEKPEDPMLEKWRVKFTLEVWDA